MNGGLDVEGRERNYSRSMRLLKGMAVPELSIWLMKRCVSGLASRKAVGDGRRSRA